MKGRRPILAALLCALAACRQASAGPAFRLQEPSSVALFWGLSAKNIGVHPYVAIANSGKDELVLFDPVDDGVVPSRVLIRPLSIPVPDPYPALVAATRFSASDGSTVHSDLLVAVSSGATELQLVRTWAGSGFFEVDPGLSSDSPVELGSEVLALLATPEVDPSGAKVKDRAWVFAALVDGRLAAVEYQLVLPAWGEQGGESIRAVTGVPIYQSPGFRSRSLAVDPNDPRFLYAATLDEIPPSGVLGVAQFDLRGAAGSLSVAALNAHAPTRLVAADTLRERNLDPTGAYDQITDVTSSATAAFQSSAVSRVYAYIDPGYCGPLTDLPCGVAVLDPLTGDLLEDPWNPNRVPKKYLRPIAIPAIPSAMVVGTPPLYAPSTDTVGFENSPYMYITSAGNRITTGVLVLPSGDGKVYFADLARWEVPSSTFELYFGYGQETQVFSFVPSDIDLPALQFFRPPELDSSGLSESYTTVTAASFIRLTPGFTQSDVWSVTYEGTLPALAQKRTTTIEKVSGDGATSVYRVAAQTASLSEVVDVYDPALGVRAGDIVEFWTSASLPSGQVCPDTPSSTAIQPIAPIEGKILEIDKPDAAHPGGSLLVAAADCAPVLVGVQTICDSVAHGPYTGAGSAFPSCWASLSTNPVPITVRAQGGAAGAEEFVVQGNSTGYAGRATTVTSTAGFPQFSFTNDNEAALVAACPLIPYPADVATVSAIDCDASCRLTCEAAAIARRARRHHLTSAECYASDTSCSVTYFPGFDSSLQQYAKSFPPPTGPVLAFSVGWAPTTDIKNRPLLVQGTQVLFQTHSGYSPAALYGAGTSGGPGTQPLGATYFDRTLDPDWNKAGDGYRFFVPYVNNTVLDLSPAMNLGGVKVLR